MDRINLVFKAMSKPQRKYAKLYYEEGLSVKEIAKKTGVSKSNVYKTIKRGKNNASKKYSWAKWLKIG